MSLAVARRLSRSLMLLVLFAAVAEAQVPAALPKPNLVLTMAGEVSSMAQQPDGGLVIVGTFTSINGVPRDGLARLLPDGSLDTQWYPRVQWIDSVPTFSTRRVYTLPDGSVLVHGDANRIDGQLLLGCGAKLSASAPLVVSAVWHQNAACPFSLAFDGQGYFYRNTATGIRRGSVDTGALDPDWLGESWQGGEEIIYDGNGGLLRQESGGRIVRVLTTSGAIDPNWNGPTNAIDGVREFVIDQARGALYIAYFLSPTRKYALATGQEIAGWTANAFPFGVRGIVVDDTGDVYLGGREAIAKLSGSSGALLQQWPANGVNRFVHDLLKLNDGRVLLGGSFARVGATRAFGLAVLPPGAAQPGALATAAQSGGSGPMARQPNGGLVVSGTFDSADGVERRRLLRIRPDGELDADWAPLVDDLITAVVADSQGDIYITGGFDTVDDTELDGGAAKLDAQTGAVEPGWNPWFSGYVPSGIVLDAADRVYISAGSTSDQLVYRILPDGSDIDATWTPPGIFGGTSLGLVRADDRLYVTIQDDQARVFVHRIALAGAALDPDWSLRLNSPVTAIARADDGDLFIGGNFSSVDVFTRYGLARVSATAPVQVRDWDPAPNYGNVRGLARSASGRLFVSGGFTAIGGKSRNQVAELSPGSGAVLDDWVAPLGGYYVALADDRIYLGPSRTGGVIAYPLDIGDTIFATHFD